MKMNSKLIRTLLLLTALSVSGLSAWAQVNNVRWQSNGSEPLDITMTSGMILQPVWLTTTSTSTNVTVVKAITTEEQLSAGDALIQNNRMAAGRGIPNERSGNSNGHLAAIAPPQSVSGTNVYTGLAYADIDEDNKTWQSSAANIDFGKGQGCDKIVKAFLYWSTGDGPTVTYNTPYPGLPTMNSYTGSGAGLGAGSSGNTDEVLFKGPGDTDYSPVTGERLANLANNADVNTFCADVTDLIQGKSGGLYWVANAKSGLGQGDDFNIATGWSLVVIFAPQDAPPRSIILYDGSAGSGSIDLTLPAPATANNISYLGYMTIDSENHAASLAKLTGNGPDCAAASAAVVAQGGNAVRVKANNGNQVAIAQFTDQDPLTFYNINGTKFCTDIYDASASSTMSTFDPATGKNGAQFLRLPSVRYNPGYDAHHLRLTKDAVPGGATSVQYLVPDDGTGGHSVRMAYLAIETAQANLKLYMQTAPMPTTVAPGGQLTYEIRVENIGTLPTVAGAYVENKLPVVADLQNLGTIQYFDKNNNLITPPSPATVADEDSDNEIITFPLPIIAAGDGLTANDWITIKYTVDIKNLDRTDIYSYGCNRFVENGAIAHYKAYAAATAESTMGTVPSGTASQLGCNETYIPVITNIVSTTLDDQYKQTHIITLENVPGNPYAANVQKILGSADANGNTTVKIDAELKAVLTQHYATLGLNPTDLPKYTINQDGYPVGNANFIIIPGESEQKYTANALLNNDCEEQFEFVLQLVSVPHWKPNPATNGANSITGCADAADGELVIQVSDGTPAYGLQLTNSNGDVVYVGYASQPTSDFKINGLAAGEYNVTVSDVNGAVYGKVTVDDPKPIVPKITSACTTDAVGNPVVKLTGTATGGVTGGTFDFVWKQGISIVHTGAEFSGVVPGIYELVVCEGACSSPAATPVTVTIPNVTVAATPTSPPSPSNTAVVSIALNDPQATFTANSELSGIDLTANYNYAWTEVPADVVLGTLNGAATYELTVGVVKDANKTGLRMNGNIYNVQVSEGTNCVGLAEGVLNVVDAPVVTLNTWTPATCPDATDATIEVTIAGGSAPQAYDIEISNQITSVYSASYTADAPQIVSLTNLPGCILEDPSTGECLQAAEYTWSVTDTSIPLTVSDSLITITATPRPVTALTVDDVCFGEELIATASGEHPNYEWKANDVLDNGQSDANFVFDYITAGLQQGDTIKVEVVALSEAFCRSMPQTAPVALKVVPEPLLQKAEITDQSPLGIPFATCVQKAGKDWADLVYNPPVLPDYPNGFELRWYNAPMGGIGTSNPELLNLGIAGEYVKYVSAVSDGCPSLRTPINAVVYDNPIIASIDKQSLQSIVITIIGGEKPYWFDYQGSRDRVTESNSLSEYTIATPEPPALGQHKFLVVDEHKCQVEGTFLINKTLLQPMPYFSPNGDKDAEYWMIENLEAYLDSHITIEIFDREGKRLFYSTGADFPTPGWDGRFNGNLLPSTDYWYNIYVEETDERFVGSFTLKR